MPYKSQGFVILLAVLALPAISISAVAQQNVTAPVHVSLSDIGNATVTLYYYDDVNGTKGAMVPMPDNPQQVNNDPGKAAAGMYTFTHVPSGQWYYLEAENNGSKWYTIFYMQEGIGTRTANVVIPEWQELHATASAVPTASPPPSTVPFASPSAMPIISDMPTPTPGIDFLPAALTLIFGGMLMALKKR